MTVVDESQPDLGPGVLPHLLLLLVDDGDGVVQETDAQVYQYDGDDDLKLKRRFV